MQPALIPPPGAAPGGTPIRPADPNLVAIANLLLCAGSGSILLGQRHKGLLAIALWLLLLLPPSCGTLSGVWAVIMALDGYQQATLLRQGSAIGPWTFFRSPRK